MKGEEQNGQGDKERKRLVFVARTDIERPKLTGLHIMRRRVLALLIDNPALLADVLESVADRAPPAVRSPHSHGSGGRFPRISTVFEYLPALDEVARRFES